MSTDRATVEKWIHDLYRARLTNDVALTLKTFSPTATFALAGDAGASKLAMRVTNRVQLETTLETMVKTWTWLDQTIITMVIDGNRAAVHHRTKMRFEPTGDVIVTELLDLFSLMDGQIVELTEFVDTALADGLIRHTMK